MLPWPIFHQELFPLWPLNLYFPYQIILLSHSPLVFVGAMTCLFNCLFFVVAWHCNFFSSSLTPSPQKSSSFSLLFQHLCWCLLWPQAPGSLSVCPGLSSVTVAQAFILPLHLLPVYVSLPCRCKRSLMCPFLLVSVLLFTSPFLFSSLTSSLSSSSVPAFSTFEII